MEHQHTKHTKKGASSKVYVEASAPSCSGSRPASSAARGEQDKAPSSSTAQTAAAGGGAAIASGAVRAVEAAEVTHSAAASLPSTRPKHAPARKLVSRLSHDISTEQLFSDQLIDGKVADGEGDDEDDDDGGSDASAGGGGGAHRAAVDNNRPRKPTERLGAAALEEDTVGTGELQCPPTKGMYRIESHSALSSLEAKNMDRHPPSSPSRDANGSVLPESSHQSLTAGRPSALKPLKLSPLPATGASPSKTQQAPPSSSASSPCEACTSNRDMPPMHCAAYSGHTECLEALLIDDAKRSKEQHAAKPSTSQPQQKRHELDKKHRTPLFYACAANRLDCVALLLQYRVDWRDLPDKQLDAPVHVCCFFGWHECLAKLLDSGADPHVRNAKGFKPSHIAKTKSCLELLLSYGDDLLQGDKLGRTPLFVASARDRAPCVEFLCAWNHQSRSWMLEQEDQRGDRPIHAAACNGSVEALEILLTYGADPVTPNGKALTPKDLASANNHLACVEILTRAEEELARATTWYAPANAVAAALRSDEDNNNSSSTTDATGSAAALVNGASGSASPDRGGWIECWDYDSGQPFYYHNLSGKCQWEVPPGFTPQLLQRQGQQLDAPQAQEEQQEQQQEEGDDDGSEYVWVKKKKQTVCVVTGKATEWTAVQDPLSKAIYYKNTRTGQSQWEEPDAVQQLQSASGAHAAQEATRIWDELEHSRTALAAALAREKHRQLAAHRQTLESYKLHIRQRREDMRKREEQARLAQLLPRSSFVRRKKQSMQMKAAPPGSSSSAKLGSSLAADDEKLEQICAKEPSLDIFLSTYLKLQGVRDLQVMTTEKRFCNCLYHYYVALVDPVAAATATSGLSKSQFRAFLRDAAIIPSAGAGAIQPTAFPLKLHVVDLIFAQAARADAAESMSAFPGASPLGSPHAKQQQTTPTPLLSHHRHGAAMVSSSSSAAGDSGSHLRLAGFLAAMQIVRDRVVAHAESELEEIDEDEEWFLSTHLLPLTLKLGAKLLTQIRECKELDMRIAASSALQAFLAQQRQLIQQLHRHYSSHEPALKMLSFRGLSQFALDFGVLLSGNLPALHQLYEAVNWISGNAHTEIISFEKFQQLLTMLASFQLTPVTTTATGSNNGGGGGQAWRAVPSFSPRSSHSPPESGGGGGGESSMAAESESHILESLLMFFQQIERSPAKHRIKTELTVSASKLSTLSSSSLRLMGTGQSMRDVGGSSSSGVAVGSSGTGAWTSTAGLVRAPSTPMMHFRSSS